MATLNPGITTGQEVHYGQDDETVLNTDEWTEISFHSSNARAFRPGKVTFEVVQFVSTSEWQSAGNAYTIGEESNYYTGKNITIKVTSYPSMEFNVVIHDIAHTNPIVFLQDNQIKLRLKKTYREFKPNICLGENHPAYNQWKKLRGWQDLDHQAVEEAWRSEYSKSKSSNEQSPKKRKAD